MTLTTLLISWCVLLTLGLLVLALALYYNLGRVDTLFSPLLNEEGKEGEEESGRVRPRSYLDRLSEVSGMSREGSTTHPYLLDWESIPSEEEQLRIESQLEEEVLLEKARRVQEHGI